MIDKMVMMKVLVMMTMVMMTTTVMIGMTVVMTKSATITTAIIVMAKHYTCKVAKQNRVVAGVYIIFWGL